MSAPKEEPDFVTIGVVLRPHGIHGEVVVEPLTDNEDRFRTLEDVRVAQPNGKVRHLRVSSMFPHKSRLVIQFQGVADMDQAESLRNAELRVPLSALPTLPAGSYYHHELKGLEVLDETGRSCGRVFDVWETGATPVLVIRDEKARETLLPLVDAFIDSVDVKEGTMRVKARGVVAS